MLTLYDVIWILQEISGEGLLLEGLASSLSRIIHQVNHQQQSIPPFTDPEAFLENIPRSEARQIFLPKLCQILLILLLDLNRRTFLSLNGVIQTQDTVL